MPHLPQQFPLALAVFASGASVATALGFVLALILTLSRWRGRGVLAVLVNVVPFVPPVLLAVVVYALRQGFPVLSGQLLRPAVLAVAAGVVSAPVVAVLAHRSLAARWAEFGQALRSCGAGWMRAAWMLLAMSGRTLMLAALAGLGRVVSEAGVALAQTEPELAWLSPGFLLAGMGVAFGAAVLVLTWER